MYLRRKDRRYGKAKAVAKSENTLPDPPSITVLLSLLRSGHLESLKHNWPKLLSRVIPRPQVLRFIAPPSLTRVSWLARATRRMA